jgi:hypothetical protein
MADVEALYQKLEKADAAGDGAAAKEFAQMIREQQSGQKPQAAPSAGVAEKPAEAGLSQSKGVTAIKGAAGGAIGAMAMPWALRAGGAVATAAGVPELGVPMIMAGNAMQAAQTASTMAAVAAIGGGAVIGGVSAPVGQMASETATRHGASPAAAGAVGAGTEMAVGASMGLAGGVAKTVGLDFVPAVARPLVKGYQAMMRQAGEVSETVSSAVASARKALQDPSLKEQPQHTLFATLQHAAEADMKGAEAAASGIEAKARAAAAALIQRGHEAAAAATAKGLANEARVRAEGQTTVKTLQAQGKAKAAAAVAEHEKEAARILAEHKAQATAAVEKAAAEAAGIRAAAKAREEALHKASEGKARRAQAVLKLQKPELAKIGEPKAPEDIGKPLAEKIQAEKAAADEARASSDATLRQARDAAVSEKETKGQFIDETAGYKDLRREIAAKLQNTEAGRAASRITTEGGQTVGLTRVKEPGVENAYQRIWDAISSKRVQVGVNENGSPVYETFRTTHEALDHVRRKLGDAAYGKEAEGYGALGQDLAKKMYQRIAKIQEEYAGPSQKALQDNYTAHLEEGAKFKSRLGRMSLDEEKSPAGIPTAFFKTRDSVQDLKALVGSPELVDRAGADYLAGKLQGESAKNVRGFLEDPKNKGWLDELPAVKAKGEAYLKSAEEAEKFVARQSEVAGKLEAKAKGLRATAKTEVQVGSKQAAKVEGQTKGQARELEKQGQQAAKVKMAAGQQVAKTETEAAKAAAAEAKVAGQKAVQTAREQTREAARAAQKEPVAAGKKLEGEGLQKAKQIRQEAQAKVDSIRKSGTPVEHIEGLINTEKDMGKLEAVAKVLQGTPGGKQQWAESVARVVTKKSPAQLDNWWQTRGRDVTKAGGATEAQLQKLDSAVEAIVRATEPKLKEQLKKRLQEGVLRALGAGMGGGLGAAMIPGGR